MHSIIPNNFIADISEHCMTPQSAMHWGVDTIRNAIWLNARNRYSICFATILSRVFNQLFNPYA